MGAPDQARRGAVRSLLLLGLALSCGDADDVALGVKRQAIVGGAPSPWKGSPLVVFERVVADGSQRGCSGVFVAPNLVLTAKHCVTTVAAGVCGTFIDPIRDPSVLSLSSDKRVPRAKSILVSPAKSMCEGDLAFLVLERGADDPVIAPLRLDAQPVVGDLVRAVGGGLTTDNDLAGLHERELTVVPPPPNSQAVSLAPSFFYVTEGLCHGDSGSPGFAKSGAVVGIASAIDFDGEQVWGAANCLGAVGIYDSPAGAREFILAGFAAAEAKPWLEGEPDPRAGLKGFDEVCTSDADCRSNVCVPQADDRMRCSHGCFVNVASDDSCASSTHGCGRVTKPFERDACLPKSMLPKPQPPESGGCSVAPR